MALTAALMVAFAGGGDATPAGSHVVAIDSIHQVTQLTDLALNALVAGSMAKLPTTPRMATTA
jgi:hypothetical protein